MMIFDDDDDDDSDDDADHDDSDDSDDYHLLLQFDYVVIHKSMRIDVRSIILYVELLSVRLVST